MVANKSNWNVEYSKRVWPFKSARWANVIVAPDDNNSMVFNNGKPQISNGWIPLGGHTPPMATEGDKLKWKKAQKKAKKKHNFRNNK